LDEESLRRERIGAEEREKPGEDIIQRVEQQQERRSENADASSMSSDRAFHLPAPLLTQYPALSTFEWEDVG